MIVGANLRCEEGVERIWGDHSVCSRTVVWSTRTPLWRLGSIRKVVERRWNLSIKWNDQIEQLVLLRETKVVRSMKRNGRRLKTCVSQWKKLENGSEYTRNRQEKKICLFMIKGFIGFLELVELVVDDDNDDDRSSSVDRSLTFLSWWRKIVWLIEFLFSF